MGADLFEQFPREVEAASQQLGYSVVQRCAEGPAELLARTDVTQPLLYLIEVLSFTAWSRTGVVDGALLAGHSLGEFAAVQAAGGVDLPTGLAIVEARGRLMAQAPDGTMAAVLGVEVERVDELVRELAVPGLEVANVNAPRQCVLSGPRVALADAAVRDAVAGLGGRIVPLKVGGAFHSAAMVDAQQQFARVLDDIDFAPLRHTVVSNVTGVPMPSTGYEHLLVEQMTSSVQWRACCDWLRAAGVGGEDVVEHGPGRTLSKLFAQNIPA